MRKLEEIIDKFGKSSLKYLLAAAAMIVFCYFYNTGVVGPVMLRKFAQNVRFIFANEKPIGYDVLHQIIYPAIFIAPAFYSLKFFFHYIPVLYKIEILEDESRSFSKCNVYDMFVCLALASILFTPFVPAVEKIIGTNFTKRLVSGSIQYSNIDLDRLRFESELIDYEEMARFPDRNKGKKVFLLGEVKQVASEKFLLVAITRNKFGWNDSILVKLNGVTPNYRILEGDLVLIHGYFEGMSTYTTVLNSRNTEPLINSLHIELLKATNKINYLQEGNFDLSMNIEDAIKLIASHAHKQAVINRNNGANGWELFKNEYSSLKMEWEPSDGAGGDFAADIVGRSKNTDVRYSVEVAGFSRNNNIRPKVTQLSIVSENSDELRKIFENNINYGMKFCYAKAGGSISDLHNYIVSYGDDIFMSVHHKNENGKGRVTFELNSSEGYADMILRKKIWGGHVCH